MPFWDRKPCPYDSSRLCSSSDYSNGTYKCTAERCPILDNYKDT